MHMKFHLILTVLAVILSLHSVASVSPVSPISPVASVPPVGESSFRTDLKELSAAPENSIPSVFDAMTAAYQAVERYETRGKSEPNVRNAIGAILNAQTAVKVAKATEDSGTAEKSIRFIKESIAWLEKAIQKANTKTASQDSISVLNKAKVATVHLVQKAKRQLDQALQSADEAVKHAQSTAQSNNGHEAKSRAAQAVKEAQKVKNDVATLKKDADQVLTEAAAKLKVADGILNSIQTVGKGARLRIDVTAVKAQDVKATASTPAAKAEPTIAAAKVAAADGAKAVLHQPSNEGKRALESAVNNLESKINILLATKTDDAIKAAKIEVEKAKQAVTAAVISAGNGANTWTDKMNKVIRDADNVLKRIGVKAAAPVAPAPAPVVAPAADSSPKHDSGKLAPPASGSSSASELTPKNSMCGSSGCKCDTDSKEFVLNGIKTCLEPNVAKQLHLVHPTDAKIVPSWAICYNGSQKNGKCLCDKAGAPNWFKGVCLSNEEFTFLSNLQTRNSKAEVCINGSLKPNEKTKRNDCMCNKGLNWYGGLCLNPDFAKQLKLEKDPKTDKAILRTAWTVCMNGNQNLNGECKCNHGDSWVNGVCLHGSVADLVRKTPTLKGDDSNAKPVTLPAKNALATDPPRVEAADPSRAEATDPTPPTAPAVSDTVSVGNIVEDEEFAYYEPEVDESEVEGI